MVEQLVEKIKARGVTVTQEDYKDCLGCTGKLYTLTYGGVLIVKDVPQEVVQEKIYDIKATLGDDYTIEDVLDKFPEEWEWSYDCRIEDLVI